MKLRILYLILAFLSVCATGRPQNPGNGLPATDALGRKLADPGETGPLREKFVGLFYWTWHTAQANQPPCIPSEIIRRYPEAALQFDHPAWPREITSYFWGEPLFGFYRDTDRWVLRKHAEMLADAGVDVLIFDCTNGSFTWKESYMELCRVFTEARRDGVATPQIAFMLAFGPTPESRKALIEIYNDLYKPGIYEELFFKWKGKPLIMAYPEMPEEATGDENAALYKEIREYFTFRPGQPVYDKGPERPDHWGWLEIAPQHGFAPDEKGKYEQATVGVAQNWSAGNGLSAMNRPGAFGRDYTAAGGFRDEADAADYGYNFQEQWERALELDPEFIFITGWNEWIAGRFENWQGQPNAFPDQFDRRHSRDIEPMKGGHGDNYYYQMVDNIRRFKGMPEQPVASAPARIRIDGSFGEWETVAPEYKSPRGNTGPRNSRGWGDRVYTDSSGRNDIVAAKAARDRRNLYFYVACDQPLTPAGNPAWMRLFIDTDRSRETGWEGYDFLVNRPAPNRKAVLERNCGGWNWKKAGRIRFAVAGPRMELKIPKRMLGIAAGKEIDLEFKWADNLREEGNAADFWVSGDSAPAGRYNFRYRTR